MKITVKTTTETEVEVNFPISFKSAYSFIHYWAKDRGIRVSIGSGTIELMKGYQFATWYEGSEIIEKSEVEAAFNAATKQAKDFWAEPKSAEL